MRELMKEEKTLYDVVEVLEQGYDAPRKRKEGTIETLKNLRAQSADFSPQ